MLVKRTLDTKTALFATALLATDSSFLLTTRWDWGPVAIQHLCMVGGVLAIVRFAQSLKLSWLFAGFFAFGVGIWDKAIFAWSLVGLGMAVLAVFPKKTSVLLNWRYVAVRDDWVDVGRRAAHSLQLEVRLGDFPAEYGMVERHS